MIDSLLYIVKSLITQYTFLWATSFRLQPWKVLVFSRFLGFKVAWRLPRSLTKWKKCTCIPVIFQHSSLVYCIPLYSIRLCFSITTFRSFTLCTWVLFISLMQSVNDGHFLNITTLFLIFYFSCCFCSTCWTSSNCYSFFHNNYYLCVTIIT